VNGGTPPGNPVRFIPPPEGFAFKKYRKAVHISGNSTGVSGNSPKTTIPPQIAQTQFAAGYETRPSNQQPRRGLLPQKRVPGHGPAVMKRKTKKNA
jgi:hypothetical protein